MAENQQVAVVSVRGHVSGSTHELEGTLSEGWRPRASWTARDERADRALDDGSGPATEVSVPAGDSDRQPAIDRNAVQHLDPVRAIFRPTSSDNLAPGLERFIGREDIFRHVGETDMASQGHRQ